MLHGLCFYIVLFLSFQLLRALLWHKSAFTHSHTFTKAGGFSTKGQPAQQELIHTRSPTNGAAIGSNVGFQYLAQGHFDMQTGGAGDRTTDLVIGRWPALLSHSSSIPPPLSFRVRWRGLLHTAYLSPVCYNILAATKATNTKHIKTAKYRKTNKISMQREHFPACYRPAVSSDSNRGGFPHLFLLWFVLLFF